MDAVTEEYIVAAALLALDRWLDAAARYDVSIGTLLEACLDEDR